MTDKAGAVVWLGYFSSAPYFFPERFQFLNEPQTSPFVVCRRITVSTQSKFFHSNAFKYGRTTTKNKRLCFIF